ncbi:MAG: MBL fold metallo-hydrolase [Bacteroidetes bacterium]|nr:MBL fold metallo-hydrolase [Bacteroidota bacterium]MBS1931636.1 MBL fold metallo-hydrolase [Bacteroidota bacterium]
MKIIPLSEGAFTIDKTKLFVPFDLNKDKLQDRAKGSLLVEIQPFAVITSHDIILLDTGLGFLDKNGKMQLHQNLLNAGIAPSDVTKVLISHLHKDHTGGISDKADPCCLSFPHAKYYIQQREIKFAFEKGYPSFITENLKVLLNNLQVVLLDQDSGKIGNAIHYQVTGAHSPYHQVFSIYHENRIVFYGGDDAPQLQQMKHRFVAKYDFNGKKAMELRRAWWQKGEQEKWTFLFYHDVKNPVWEF